MSIARSLLSLTLEHAPAGTVVKGIVVRAGPLQAVDPVALGWAWQALTAGTRCDGAGLEVRESPWVLACPGCGARFEGASLEAVCACGRGRCTPVGGDELVLESLDVDGGEIAENDHERVGHPERAEGQ